MKISDALIPELDHETATTRKVLARCPEDKFGWKPHEKSFNMGSLATHIVKMYGWGVDVLELDNFDYAPVGAPPYKEEPYATTEALLAAFDKNIAKLRAALAKAPDESMMKDWSLLAGGQVVFTMPRVVVMRSMIFNHLVHHRGQLSVYLRLNNVPVPAIYGPSADES